MTRQEYADYQKRVSEFFMREGIEHFSSKPPANDWEDYPEPYFSWHWCDCCSTPLGGNREDYIADNGFEYSICEDCVYYNEYGRLDDLTMWNMENEAQPVVES